jgi:hypothetical protein
MNAEFSTLKTIKGGDFLHNEMQIYLLNAHDKFTNFSVAK